MGRVITRDKDWAIKDLEIMQKHIKNAKNFKFDSRSFKFKKDRSLNERLNNYLGLALACAEILERRIKKED